MVNAGTCEGMVFANNILRKLPYVCSQIPIGMVVAGQTLVSRNSGAFENGSGGEVNVYPCQPRWAANPPPH